MKVRGGSREMDMMLKEAGASVLSLPSNEIYAAMQTGAMDAAMTSSTSLISFRLEEIAKSLTSGAQQGLLVHVRAAADVQADLRQAAEGAAGRDHGASARSMEKFAPTRPRPTTRRSPSVYAKARRQGLRPRRGHGREVAGHRARHGWKDYADERDVGRAAEGRAKAAVTSTSPGRLAATPSRRPRRACVARASRRRSSRAPRWRIMRSSCVPSHDGAACWPARCRSPTASSRAISSRPRPTGRTRSRCSARRRHLPVRRIRAVACAATSASRRVASCCRRASTACACIVVDIAEPRVLRLLRLEVVDAAARGLGRQADHVVVVGAAALDSLLAHVGRHDAAERCRSLLQAVHAAAAERRERRP